MRTLLAAVVILLALAPDAASGQADAYRDEKARELVREARARRVTVDRRIDAYRTTAVERISVGLQAGIMEKLLFRRETATRVDWRRDGPVQLEVIGAREVVPPFKGAPQVPAGLTEFVPHLAFDPVDSEMLLRFDTTVIRHPLAAGSEAHYRFSTGDSTTLRLPDGRTVRLRELRIQPRRRDHHLINGSFWLDMQTHAVVQAYFRLADQLGGDNVPFIGRVGGQLDYIAIDYGFWDLRWWLPRAVAARGVMHVGRFRMPINYERRYAAYTIIGDTMATPPVPGEAPVMETRPCRPRMSVAIQVGVDEDSLEVREARSMERRRFVRDSIRAARAAAGEAADTSRFCDREFTVTRAPSDELLTSELLPADIYDNATGFFLNTAELEDIARRVQAIGEAPWQLKPPRLELPLLTPGLIRYNRVEGLAPAVRARLDVGVAAADAELRYGIADETLRGEFGIERRGHMLTSRIAGYRRLAAVDVAAQPFTFTSNVAALVVGRDDNDYFDALGAELRFIPGASRRQWYDLRLFAERQRPVGTNTDFSLAHAIDDEHVFRPNLVADSATQFGGVLRLRSSIGLDPRDPRLAAELELHGEAGDFGFVRPSLLVRSTLPLGRTLTAGVEAAAGTALGDIPLQRNWQIGGVTTIRGYDGGALRGDSYWRGRAELGLGLPFARLAVFSDAGWAGPRDNLAEGRPLKSVGIGAGIMDGLLRIDLARALDLQRAWKLHVQMNGIL